MIKSIGIELRSLDNLIMRKFENSDHKKQIDSVTGTNGWIIGYLADNVDKDVFQRDLEEQFTITRSTVSKVIILMEKKGLIERHSVPYDSRLKKLVLTDKAWKISELLRECGSKIEEDLIKGFNEKELDTLCGYIQRMKENMR